MIKAAKRLWFWRNWSGRARVRLEYACPWHSSLSMHRRNVPVPHFLDWGTVPPLFRTHVKNLRSSEVICGRWSNYSKTVCGRGPPRTPSPESSCLVSVPKHAKFAGGLSPQTLTHLYFFLLTCATICFLALFGAAKPMELLLWRISQFP